MLYDTSAVAFAATLAQTVKSGCAVQVRSFFFFRYSSSALCLKQQLTGPLYCPSIATAFSLAFIGCIMQKCYASPPSGFTFAAKRGEFSALTASLQQAFAKLTHATI